MDFFFGSSSQPPQTPDVSLTIDKLCDRVRDADLLEDRRSAVQGLRGLSREFQLQVGTKGMPVLIEVLKTDRMDVEIIKLALETLTILCSKDKKSNGVSLDLSDLSSGKALMNGASSEELGGMLAEIFVKDPANIALLLDILSEVEFYVRFSTVTLLTTLYESVGDGLHEGILASPLGISRLIDLLDDKREIIRNEGLLLLIKLTSVNADIQKIIAFESAFERLFSIIFEEGSIDGGIIVQDCIQLMHNLLRYNASNQNLFRETNCIKQIPKLLFSKQVDGRGEYKDIPISNVSVQWEDQKEINTVFVMELIRILVEGKNQNAVTNQNLLGQSNMITVLLEVAVEGRIPVTIRGKALLALADLIRGNDANRERFGNSIVSVTIIPEAAGLPNQKPPPGTPTPSDTVLLQLILEKQPFELRASAAYTFLCYMSEHPEAQLGMTRSVTNFSSSGGKLWLSSVLDVESSRKDHYKSIFATKLLALCLYGNKGAKDLLLATSFEEHGEKISLLSKVCYALLCSQKNGFDSKIEIGLLSLLSVWLYEHPKSVKEFLTEGSNVQSLVEQINQSSNVDPLVQGLCAFLYGILYQFNDNSEPVFSQTNLHNLLQSRIGLDIFISRVQRLKETKAYNRNDKIVLDDGEYSFDQNYQDFIRDHLDSIIKAVTSKPKPASPVQSPGMPQIDPELENKLAAANQLIEQKDYDISQLQNELGNTQNELQNALAELQNLQYHISQMAENQNGMVDLQEQLAQIQADYQALHTDHEDLLMMMNDQDEEIQELKDRLRAYGEEFPEEEEEEEIIDLQH